MSAVLLVPGWRNSGAEHWQTRWALERGYVRVEQAEWNQPRCEDWLATLETAVQAAPEGSVIVAHSLGCHLVARFSASSPAAARVRCALLVAPPDLDRPEMAEELLNFRPITWAPLRFPATVVASENDPHCSVARARLFAEAWTASLVLIGDRGHINGESDLGAWPAGHHLLEQLLTAD